MLITKPAAKQVTGFVFLNSFDIKLLKYLLI